MAGEYVNKEFLDAMAELEQTKGIKMDVLLEARSEEHTSELQSH